MEETDRSAGTARACRAALQGELIAGPSLYRTAQSTVLRLHIGSSHGAWGDVQSFSGMQVAKAFTWRSVVPSSLMVKSLWEATRYQGSTFFRAQVAMHIFSQLENPAEQHSYIACSKVTIRPTQSASAMLRHK